MYRHRAAEEKVIFPYRLCTDLVNAQSVNGQSTPSGTPERNSFLVPPHVAWPLFVVLLLAMSVGAALFTAYMANADGGVQVVEGSDYSPDADR